MSTSPALSSGMPKAQEATAARASSTDAEPGAVASTLTLEGSLRWWADDEDRQVRWKLDYHIVPWLFVTYLLAFLDRSNIGNANTAGLSKSLGISDSKYQWLLTIFYISYITCQCLLIGYKLVPPSKFMGCCVTIWGIAAILQGAAFNWSGLMAARFFIGMSEAGYGTGVALYLSFFYPRDEIGVRFAGFVVGSTIASAIAGSIAYGLQSAHASIDSWRLIFVVEAAPTVILGGLLFIALPDSISTARFLTPYERQIAEARLYRAAIDRRSSSDNVANIDDGSHERKELNGIMYHGTAKTARTSEARGRSAVFAHIRSSLSLNNGLDAFKDPMSYITTALLFLINVGFASIPVYLPTILQGMGYTSIRAQAFSAPPYVASFVVAMAATYTADKTQTRGLLLALMTCISIAGYFMLATIQDNHARYGAVWLVVIGLFSSVPLCYMWLVSNSSGETKRGFALIFLGTIGQCGPVLGTRLFPKSEGPHYTRGMYVNAGLLLGELVIILAGLALVASRNRKKDRALAEAQRQSEDGGRGRKLEEDAGSAAGAGAGAGSEPSSTQQLRFKRKLDTRIPAERDELHRRRVDISLHREQSLYFRYYL